MTLRGGGGGGGLSRDVKNCSRVSTFCDGVGMLRQTTVFCEALPSKKYFVCKNPIDTYQKFVEVFAASTTEENRRHDYAYMHMTLSV